MPEARGCNAYPEKPRRKSHSERTEKVLERQIEKTDCEIDERMFELYGISDREKELIEASMKRRPLLDNRIDIF